MIDPGTLVLVVLLVFGAGVFAGQWSADYRRARTERTRVMRPRSNYRRARNNQNSPLTCGSERPLPTGGGLLLCLLPSLLAGSLVLSLGACSAVGAARFPR